MLLDMLVNNIKIGDYRFMLSLYVIVMGFMVWVFAANYLKGETIRSQTLRSLIFLNLAILLFINTMHMMLIILAWAASSYTYYLLINTQTNIQDTFANKFIVKSLIINNLLLSVGIISICIGVGCFELQPNIKLSINNNWYFYFGMANLLLAIIGMSAAIPFHKWILNSLHVPTPISAIMHAGFINAGGILIIKFWPLISAYKIALNMLFMCGIITAIVANYWKLIQSDYKRMLVCSTIAQMGFMLMQCGIGLLNNAIVHICGHGFFKAYLFLRTDEAVNDKIIPKKINIYWLNVVVGIVMGAVCVAVFSSIIHQKMLANNSMLLIKFILFVTICQLFIEYNLYKIRDGLFAIVLSLLFSVVYGAVSFLLDHYSLIETDYAPLGLLHWIGLGLIFISWLYIMAAKRKVETKKYNNFDLSLYVSSINLTQPNVNTFKLN